MDDHETSARKKRLKEMQRTPGEAVLQEICIVVIAASVILAVIIVAAHELAR